MRKHQRLSSLLRTPIHAWNFLIRGYCPFVYDQMDLALKCMSWKKRYNLFKSGMNLIYRRPKSWTMPLHMMFELTNYCNLQCPVCPTGTNMLDREKRHMDPALFTRIVDEVGPYLLTASLWAWGEPLLHPHIEDILTAIQKHKIISFLSTNGQTLNDEQISNTLIESPPTHLIVALDGLNDETNSRYRHGAKLEPALSGVRQLAELKKKRGVQLPVLHMRFIAMKHNQHQVGNLQAFARDHQFDLLTIRTLSIMDKDRPDDVHQDLVPDKNELRAYRYDNNKRI